MNQEKNIFKNIRMLEIKTRRFVDSVFQGDYTSHFKGKGLDFVSLKEYEEGDDVGNIDWPVTARLDEPYVKTYREERELPVILVIDRSPSMKFGINSQRKWDAVIEVSSALIFSAVRSNSRVGLIIFSDKIEQYIPPKKGKGHAFRILKWLGERVTGEGRKTDLHLPLQFLRKVVKKKAIVFFISDFYFPLEKRDWLSSGKLYDLIAVRISDKDEIEFPDIGLVDIVDSETGEYLSFDSSDNAFRDGYLKSIAAAEKERHKFFSGLRIDDVLIRTDRPLTAPFLSLFYRRARQGIRV
ncbi:MAG: DUF58 domain-containing protein [Nitrospirae bacterium]|nr:DUF58 domain-containing protein [Nitrospirota bacterium]